MRRPKFSIAEGDTALWDATIRLEGFASVYDYAAQRCVERDCRQIVIPGGIHENHGFLGRLWVIQDSR